MGEGGTGRVLGPSAGLEKLRTIALVGLSLRRPGPVWGVGCAAPWLCTLLGKMC